MSSTIRFCGYPAGAIQNQAQLQDIVTEARKEKKAIRLYGVSQGGYFEELFITSKTKIRPYSENSDIMIFEHFVRSNSFGKKWYKSHSCLADRNITDKNGRSGGHNRHMIFANRGLAKRYSEFLSNNIEYQNAVKMHHAECSKLFRFSF